SLLTRSTRGVTMSGRRDKTRQSVPTSEKGPRALLLAFEVSVILPTVGALGVSAFRAPKAFPSILLMWALVIALVELLPVPSWRGLQISTGFPLMMAVAFLYSPWAAAATAFLGASDPREFRREVSITKALFNRSQITLSVLLASFT